MNYRFTNNLSPVKLDEVVEYTLGPRLWIPTSDYPDQAEWATKAHRELKQESKRVIVALHNRTVIDSIIYQEHKTEPNTLEVKRITVRPDQQGRYVASFLLRQAEIQGAADFNTASVMIDAKVRNDGIRQFLLRHKYTIVDKLDLYGLGAGDDYLYRKELSAIR